MWARLLLVLTLALLARNASQLTAPPMLNVDALSLHVGHTVRIQGAVVEARTQAGSTWLRVADDTGTIDARLAPGPEHIALLSPGTPVRLEGRVDAGREGPLFWEATATALGHGGPLTPRDITRLSVVLDHETVHVHGIAQHDRLTLDGAHVPLAWPTDTERPDPGTLIDVHGTLVPAPDRPALILEVTTWTPSSPA